MAWQRVACVLAACALSEVVLAQANPVLFYGSEHVVVDVTSPAGREYVRNLSASRPTPIVRLPDVTASGNVGKTQVVVDLGAHSCGARSDTRLVLCLNEEGRLSYSDSLALLAFASHPTTAYVPDETVRQYVASLLARLPTPTQGEAVQILTATCAASCTHRIRLERRT